MPAPKSKSRKNAKAPAVAKPKAAAARSTARTVAVPPAALAPKRESAEEKSRRATACHEASHAVVLNSFGFEVISISIVPDKKTAGRCEVWPPGRRRWDDLDKEQMRNYVIGLQAGVWGTRIVRKRESVLTTALGTLSGDWGAIQQACGGEFFGGDKSAFFPDNLVAELARIDYLDGLDGVARAMVTAHRAAIEALAALLLEKGSIDGNEFDRFMEAW